MRLLLASASPRRADLLQAAGFDFDVLPADVDESVRPGETAEAYALRVSLDKAAAVSTRAGDRVVLAADTVVVVEGRILGKPVDAADAARMLRLLSGRRHQVLTAVVVVRAGQSPVSAVERTEVEMTHLSDEDVASYVASGEPMDKAGAYAVQGLASRWVTRIEGSYAGVVGLPVALVHRLVSGLVATGLARPGDIDPGGSPGYSEPRDGYPKVRTL